MVKVVINEATLEYNEAGIVSGISSTEYQEEVILEFLPNIGDQLYTAEKKTFTARKIVHIAKQDGKEPYTMVYGERN